MKRKVILLLSAFLLLGGTAECKAEGFSNEVEKELFLESEERAFENEASKELGNRGQVLRNEFPKINESLNAKEEISVGDWSYRIAEGTAVISGYHGSSSSVTLPSAVNYGGMSYKLRAVDAAAFENNTTLRSVVIPKSITSLGDRAFKNCTNLSSVTINGNIGDCHLGSTWSDYRSVFYNAGANTSTFSVTFGPSVTRIPAYLFATGSSAADGEHAHITSLTMSSAVREIGKGAFYSCYDLSEICWGSGLRKIDEEAFLNNQSITSLKLPSRVTSIGSEAFVGCFGLKTIVLPKSVTSLGDNAFRDCTNLSSLLIEGNIGDCHSGSMWAQYRSVFYNTGSNADSFKVTFGPSVTRIPAYLFATGSSESDNRYAYLTSVTIPSKVRSIGKGAFYNCHRLSSVSVSSKTAVVEEEAFAHCKPSLTFRCYTGSPVASYAKANGYKISNINLPKVEVSSITNTADGVKLSWKKVSGATGYHIYRKTANGKYSRVKTISGSSALGWTDTSVKSKNGSTYYYAVRAYNGSRLSGTYDSHKIVSLGRRAILGISNPSGKKIYVKWDRNSKASGYQIQYSTSSSFASGKKTITISGNTNTSKTITGLTKGKTYYVRERCYKTVSGKKRIYKYETLGDVHLGVSSKNIYFYGIEEALKGNYNMLLRTMDFSGKNVRPAKLTNQLTNASLEERAKKYGDYYTNIVSGGWKYKSVESDDAMRIRRERAGKRETLVKLDKKKLGFSWFGSTRLSDLNGYLLSAIEARRSDYSAVDYYYLTGEMGRVKLGSYDHKTGKWEK